MKDPKDYSVGLAGQYAFSRSFLRQCFATEISVSTYTK